MMRAPTHSLSRCWVAYSRCSLGISEHGGWILRGSSVPKASIPRGQGRRCKVSYASSQKLNKVTSATFHLSKSESQGQSRFKERKLGGEKPDARMCGSSGTILGDLLPQTVCNGRTWPSTRGWERFPRKCHWSKIWELSRSWWGKDKTSVQSRGNSMCKCPVARRSMARLNT